ncbi:MAG TPA: methyltransferase domain-containing protein [Thermomicrobiales bacterium]|nr:methyltransferase domain-containing protein [Thermomicrobiales bacterium]
MKRSRRSVLGPTVLRKLRRFAPLRPLFFVLFGRSYAALWDSFAITDGTAREAILAGVGADEARFWSSGQRDAERYVIPLLRPEAVVLDLGGGIGRIARAVAPHCRRLILADVSRSMLRRARNALRGTPNIEFVKTSGKSLASVASNSVDVAYSHLVLQHVEREDVISYLGELHRVLVPGGVIRFQVPNLADPQQLSTYVEYALATPAKSLGRLRYYTREEIQLLLERLGFSIESVESTEWHVVTARRGSASQQR